MLEEDSQNGEAERHEEKEEEEEEDHQHDYLSSTRIQLPDTDVMLAKIREPTTTARNQMA